MADSPRIPLVGVIFAGLIVLLGLGGAGAWWLSQQGDPNFKPEVGQEGKDVIWVPTPDGLVSEMLRRAKVTKDDYVVDLGSGDGKIAIAAAKEFGARAHGIEFNPDMVAVSKRKAKDAGVDDRATFQQGDIFVEDFSSADVVTMYLLPRLNMKLRPTLLAMEPGTRLVSHAFDMGEWAPDETFEVDGRKGFLWIVPANVAGAWRIPLTTGELIEVNLTQAFQNVKGAAAIAGRAAAVKSATLRGKDLSFVVEDWRGGEWIVRGEINGAAFKGSISRGGGDVERFFEVSREAGAAAPPAPAPAQ
jgi:SAM-dependent methyltransferase